MDPVADIEAALVAHWSRLGRWPGAQLHDDDGLLWYETPLTHLPFNGVIRTALPDGDGADRAIRATLERFRARGVRPLWFDHPGARPADLGARLHAHGLRAAAPITCMSLEVGDAPDAPPPPAGVAIREVRDDADVDAYTDLTVRYWEIPARERPLVARMHRAWDRDAGRRYLVLLDGDPVGKGYLSLAGPPGVAAIFGMSTRPRARGRGIAAALTGMLVGAARDAGCHRVVLHSTAMAVGLYRRAGFTERCTMTIHADAPLFHAGGPLTGRRATRADLPALAPLIDAAIDRLQRPFLDEEQIASSRAIMGLDRELVDDGTYFVVECDGRIAGCGGWSRRATVYGSHATPGRDSTLLDPARDAARIRAMYTHPDFARRGVGRLLLELSESAAAAEGFTRLELMSTLAGAPLYRAAGYEPLEHTEDATGGAPVPLIRMGKTIAHLMPMG